MHSLYRALLRLYPASFRAEYGAELARTFAETSRHHGRVGGAFAALRDVLPNALAAHWAILTQDLRYAVRKLVRAPGFALTVVLVTAVGVGANTATFSVADFVLLRPLPFPEPDRLVRLCEGPREGGGWGCMNELSPANYRDVTAANLAVEGWGAFTGGAVNLVGAGPPLRLNGVQVTAQVLPLIGIAPLLGRVFDTTGARDRDNRSAVLSYGLWQSQFGGDQAVVGRTIRLDDQPYVIIGVMPAGYQFPSPDVQIWTPLVLTEDNFANRDNTYLHGVGRLRPGASFEQLRADLAQVFERLARDYPETNAETGFSFFRLRDQVFPRFRIMLVALCGASLSLLLLTAANLANLLLARGASRERELAVRAALGAGRERLVRQTFTESALLALLGGAAGVLVAALALPLLAHLVPTGVPLAGQPRLDLRVLLLAGTFTVLIALGFGLLPALRFGGRTGFSALREGAQGGGVRRQRLRAVLVTVEVAVSVILLVSSGLLIRAALNVRAVQPGFQTEGVLTLRTALSTSRAWSRASREDFYQRVLEQVRALPGVAAAGYTSGIPMVLTGGIAGVEVPGEEPRPRRDAGVSYRLVTPGLLDALGIPVLEGRGVADADRIEGPLVVVVSQSFVERHWPGRSALGRTFRVRNEDRTVVGVVPDIRVRGLERSSEPQLYVPSAQAPDTIGMLYDPKDLVVRVRGSAAALIPQVREVIAQVDPEQPVSSVRLLSEVVEGQTTARVSQLRVLAALAAVALLLTGIGIHGLLAFLVAQRAREIGVRLALGAEPGRVGRMIIGEAGKLALLGAVPGLLAAYAAARAMRALLFGIEPTDPFTIGAGVVVVALVTFAGALVPAFRAIRTSPLLAMKAD